MSSLQCSFYNSSSQGKQRVVTESALLKKESSVSDERKKRSGKIISSNGIKIRNVWVQKMKKVDVNRGAMVLQMFSSLPPVARKTKFPCHIFLRPPRSWDFLPKKGIGSCWVLGVTVGDGFGESAISGLGGCSVKLGGHARTRNRVGHGLRLRMRKKARVQWPGSTMTQMGPRSPPPKKKKRNTVRTFFLLLFFSDVYKSLRFGKRKKWLTFTPLPFLRRIQSCATDDDDEEKTKKSHLQAEKLMLATPSMQTRREWRTCFVWDRQVAPNHTAIAWNF